MLKQTLMNIFRQLSLSSGNVATCPADLSYGVINKNLELKNQYTEKIDEFINSLISKGSK